MAHITDFIFDAYLADWGKNSDEYGERLIKDNRLSSDKADAFYNDAMDLSLCSMKGGFIDGMRFMHLLHLETFAHPTEKS